MYCGWLIWQNYWQLSGEEKWGVVSDAIKPYHTGQPKSDLNAHEFAHYVFGPVEKFDRIYMNMTAPGTATTNGVGEPLGIALESNDFKGEKLVLCVWYSQQWTGWKCF